MSENIGYEISVGLEVHAELKTKSKIFCGCPAGFGGEPNTQCCPVCSGMPGVLPVLNKEAVRHAVMAGLALGCDIERVSVMDRKNYFYPDLPKAYQISQLYKPLCKNGRMEINAGDTKKNIRIKEIHLEEDAGKLIHDEIGNRTFIDFNRCGVPLIEIVTMPDMCSSGEVREFLENLKNILEYIEVSDCKMQEGSLRADVNLSIKDKGCPVLGTRTEMKNLNSFRSIIKAVESEALRQRKIIEQGGRIIQETRRWSDADGCSYPMRSKEEAHDYRYFPEPDLNPIIINDEYIREIYEMIPELPNNRARRYSSEYGLSDYDSRMITSSKKLADFFERTVTKGADPKKAANWLMGDYLKMHNDGCEDEPVFRFSPEGLAEMIQLIKDGRITGRIAKDVFEKMYTIGGTPRDIIKKDRIEILSDTETISNVIKKVLAENPGAAEDYKSGKAKAAGFIIGRVMRETGGKADPVMVKDLIIKQLTDI